MRKRALLIGVNDYPLLGDLKYAEADANGMSESLQRNYGFSKSEIHLMTTSLGGGFRPTLSFVEEQLRVLRDTCSYLDFMLVGFWGHGRLSPDRRSRYLCLADSSDMKLAQTSLTLEMLTSWLTQIGAQNTCLILDCCQTETARNGSDLMTSEETETISRMTTAMARDIKARREQAGHSVFIPPTFAILNSCSAGEKAYEWEKRQHGLFTAHLLDGMDQRLDSVTRWATYVSQTVPQSALTLSRRQTPFFKLEGSGDIGLEVTPKKPKIPIPPTVKTEKIWHIHTTNGNKNHTEKVLIDLIRAGEISRNTLIWTAGMMNWEKIDNLPKFRDIFPPKPKPSPKTTPVSEEPHPPVLPKTFLKWDEFKSIDVTQGEFESLQQWEDRIKSYQRIQLGECTLTRYNVNEKKYLVEITIDKRVANKVNNPSLQSYVDLPMENDFAKSIKGRDWPMTTKLSILNNQIKVKDTYLEISNRLFPIKLADAAGSLLVISYKGIDYRFRWCPAGEFMMGSPTTEEGYFDDETQHKVRLTKGFWMLETPVTQQMWSSVMKNMWSFLMRINPSYFAGEFLPVERVSWKDSQSFISKLNAAGLITGFKFSLPTEAQWEYACRAGTSTSYHFGNSLNGDDANCDSYDSFGDRRNGSYLKKTSKVGSFNANAWGLYDMHGNVCEWCQDWYDSYPSETTTDPTGPYSGSARVYRGGSWVIHAGFCRSANRGRCVPSRRNSYVGFRLALVPTNE